MNLTAIGPDSATRPDRGIVLAPRRPDRGRALPVHRTDGETPHCTDGDGGDRP